MEIIGKYNKKAALKRAYRMRIKNKTNTLIRNFDHGIKINIVACKDGKEEKFSSISNLHGM